ncbi:heat shock 70 kDa protein 15-like protein [Tanacetum coccineum]|uniref:Heat shock 70 kDa protein 15-like protein n=1 Tax=Tanacetum coccineum TaxID=301880 RepID=A0ABQ5HGM7_9ASTR
MYTNPSPDCCHCSPDFTSSVFNECSEVENWLRDAHQVQDGLPKHAEPVLLSADIRKREEAIDSGLMMSSHLRSRLSVKIFLICALNTETPMVPSTNRVLWQNVNGVKRSRMMSAEFTGSGKEFGKVQSRNGIRVLMICGGNLMSEEADTYIF